MSEKLFVGLGYDYSTTILKDFNDGTYEIIFKIGLFNNRTIMLQSQMPWLILPWFFYMTLINLNKSS